MQSPLLEPVLTALERLNLEQGYLCAGGVAQTVWNHLLGKPLEYGIKDLDVIYFDSSDLSEESETQTSHALERILENGSVPLDVKNEARVHLWYAGRFGYSIAPYLPQKMLWLRFLRQLPLLGSDFFEGRLRSTLLLVWTTCLSLSCGPIHGRLLSRFIKTIVSAGLVAGRN